MTDNNLTAQDSSRTLSGRITKYDLQSDKLIITIELDKETPQYFVISCTADPETQQKLDASETLAGRPISLSEVSREAIIDRLEDSLHDWEVITGPWDGHGPSPGAAGG